MRQLLTLAALVVLTACGGSTTEDELTVFAAASLREVFSELAPDARFQFGGSDELAVQIREGAPADVYAAASPRFPDELFAEGVIERPRTFATNRLVIIVPSDNPAGIESVRDLRREGVRLVIGAVGVPVGDYTRLVLEAIDENETLRSVVSEEDNVKGVVAKVALGEADAGFVYTTDVKPVADDVRMIELPEPPGVDILYPVAVVTDTDQPRRAREFIELLLGETGRQALLARGFGVP